MAQFGGLVKALLKGLPLTSVILTAPGLAGPLLGFIYFAGRIELLIIVDANSSSGLGCRVGADWLLTICKACSLCRRLAAAAAMLCGVFATTFVLLRAWMVLAALASTAREASLTALVKLLTFVVLSSTKGLL